jgi:hypothetical protein
MKWVRGRFSLAIPENIRYIEFQSAGTRSAAGPALFPVPGSISFLVIESIRAKFLPGGTGYRP